MHWNKLAASCRGNQKPWARTYSRNMHFERYVRARTSRRGLTAETLLQGSPTRVFVELSKVKESNEKLKDRGSGAAKRFLRRQVSLCYPHLCNPKTRVFLSSFDSVNIRRSNELNQSWPLVASFGRRSKSCHVRPRKAASCTPRRSRGEASATSQLPDWDDGSNRIVCFHPFVC